MTRIVSAILDSKVNKLVSRKFLAWIVACVFVATRVIDADNWMIVTGIYLLGQTYLDKMKAKNEYLDGVK